MSERPRKQPQKLTARRVLFQWRVPVIIVLFLIVLCCIPVGLLTHLLSKPKEPEAPRTDEQYQLAVYDTLLAENHELPANMSPQQILVTLAPGSTGVDFDDNGRVLLCMWHRNPETYPAGTDVTLSYDNVTAVSLRELTSWYSNPTHNKEFGKDNVDLRLQQLFGLPPLTDDNSKNTHFTIFWVNPESVVRPAYSSDVMTTVMTNSFVSQPDDVFYNWFTANTHYNYCMVNRAWTRMGYTYDWYPYEEGPNDTLEEKAARHFGLTEFLVNKDQTIHVVSTSTTSNFLQQLAADASTFANTPAEGGETEADTKDNANADAKDDKDKKS